MKSKRLACCVFAMITACGGSSSSSKDTPQAAPMTAPNATGGADASSPTAATDITNGTESPNPDAGTAVPPAGETGAPADKQTILALNTASIAFSRLQYDCGDIKAPVADAAVLPDLLAIQDITTMAATIPAKDHALLTIKTKGSCDYRAIFDVNASFTRVTYGQSQALSAEILESCGSERATIDQALSAAPLVFDYDKQFIRWVALHIPGALQSSPVCPSGSLRAVFAAQLN